LFSKYVGDSEKAVRTVFSRARASSPAVIFIDEVDGLAGTRGGGGEGGAPSVQDRVITQLLGEMDGLLPTANVTVVAATNRPDLVDAALLRPGRFDRLLYVPPPSEAEDRAAILRVQLKNTPLADDVDLTMAALATKGYTGADLSAICREAALAALEESLDATEVCARHVSTAMSRVRPSPAPKQELLDMYEKFRRQ
jgi:SpoVK/Ycf46/Vps4 family AAA+-type ATPase